MNQRRSSANTPSGRGPAKGAKASRERGEKREDVRGGGEEFEDGSGSKKMNKETSRKKNRLRVLTWQKKNKVYIKRGKREKTFLSFLSPVSVFFVEDPERFQSHKFTMKYKLFV